MGLTGDGTDRCRCGHPEGEHTTAGDCAVHRRGGGEECGCPGFVSEEDEQSRMAEQDAWETEEQMRRTR